MFSFSTSSWPRTLAFRDPAEVPIALDSQRCWEEISRAIDYDTGFSRQGILSLAETDKELAEYEDWLLTAGEYGVDSRLFSRSEISRFIDIPEGRWRGGMITPGDCRAEPFKAVPAIASGLHKRGGLIRESCAVRTIDLEAGKVSGVVTEAGRVKTQAIVCAAGAWSNMFLTNLGVSFPQLLVRGTVARTVAAPKLFDGAAGLQDVYLRRRQDGGYTVSSEFNEHTVGVNSFRYFMNFLPALYSDSEIHLRLGRDAGQPSIPRQRWSGDETAPFEQHRVLNPAPSKDALRIMRRNLAKRVPQLAGVELAEAWAGMIDTTPDIVPVMDQIESLPGLFLASGFSGHGFGIGPGAGKVMANLVVGNATGFDLSRFRFSRFSDGTRMTPGPAI